MQCSSQRRNGQPNETTNQLIDRPAEYSQSYFTLKCDGCEQFWRTCRASVWPPACLPVCQLFWDCLSCLRFGVKCSIFLYTYFIKIILIKMFFFIRWDYTTTWCSKQKEVEKVFPHLHLLLQHAALRQQAAPTTKARRLIY